MLSIKATRTWVWPCRALARQRLSASPGLHSNQYGMIAAHGKSMKRITERGGSASSMSQEEGVVLNVVTSEDAINEECAWMSNQIQTWLDEEWEVLDVHKEVGDEAAIILGRLRASGETDLGSILLSMGAELTPFDFTETYTGPYDVANKVAELLMVRMGREVCCVSEDDKRRTEL